MENACVEEYHKTGVTKISIQNSDCWFMLYNSNFACVKNVQEKGFLCELYKRNQFQDYFENPCTSGDINVYLIKRSAHFERKMVHPRDFKKKKVILLSTPDGKPLLVLLNDVIWN